MVRVGVDASHGNRHTLGGSYAPFGELIEERLGEAGPRGRMRSVPHLGPAVLDELDVLVMAGLNDAAVIGGGQRELLTRWVSGGGGLLLVVDHPPYVGSSIGLAGDLGFALTDRALVSDRGFTELVARRGIEIYDHPVVDGPFGSIDTLRFAFGTAFQVEGQAVVRVPDSWSLRDLDSEETEPATGLAVLGAAELGAGRVVVCGEASALTCQEGEERDSGFCREGREAQQVLVLNTIAWLADGPLR